MSSNSRTSVRSKADKYSLRPRVGERRKRRFDPDEGEVDVNSKRNSINNKSTIKQRQAPLSKYRRKTANARERSRMREINLAFETLRKAVPSYMPQLVFPGDGSNEKLTKITTLRLAMKYISGLTELLHKNDKAFVTTEFTEFSDCCNTVFRDGDTCTLTALNASNFDLLGTASNNGFNDGGSDGESSFHSGATLDNFIEHSIESLVPELSLDFPGDFFTPELS